VLEKIEKLRTTQAIKNRAETTTERANDIIMSHIANIQNERTILIMPAIPKCEILLKESEIIK
jgi:hypothetical protein